MENESPEYGLGESRLPFCAQINDVAPLFKTDAYDTVEKEIKEVSLKSYRGKWVVLFFYGSDFTFV